MGKKKILAKYEGQLSKAKIIICQALAKAMLTEKFSETDVSDVVRDWSPEDRKVGLALMTELMKHYELMYAIRNIAILVVGGVAVFMLCKIVGNKSFELGVKRGRYTLLSAMFAETDDHQTEGVIVRRIPDAPDKWLTYKQVAECPEFAKEQNFVRVD